MAVAGINTNSAANAAGAAVTAAKKDKLGLKAEDFIKMMVTQLQNQDPLEPAKNEQLLSQMSQIGQLQSSDKLQSSLSTMVLQNNIGSASNVIGKTVKGIDDQKDDVEGIVNSVKVEDGNVYLELDNGKRLSFSNVTHIAGTAVGAPTTPVTPPAN